MQPVYVTKLSGLEKPHTQNAKWYRGASSTSTSSTQCFDPRSADSGPRGDTILWGTTIWIGNIPRIRNHSLLCNWSTTCFFFNPLFTALVILCLSSDLFALATGVRLLHNLHHFWLIFIQTKYSPPLFLKILLLISHTVLWLPYTLYRGTQCFTNAFLYLTYNWLWFSSLRSTMGCGMRFCGDMSCMLGGGGILHR